MEHIKTSTGFEADIDKSCFNDMELLDAILDIQAGNMLALPVIVSKIMGDAKKALYGHCRDEKGKVGADRIMMEVNEIVDILNAKKS